jgi:sec-independent protein translocase protein TatA
MLPHLGLPELLLILAIVVVLFGVNKLPRLGKGLGEGIRNFKDAIRSAGKDDGNDQRGPNEGAAGEPK